MNTAGETVCRKVSVKSGQNLWSYDLQSLHTFSRRCLFRTYRQLLVEWFWLLFNNHFDTYRALRRIFWKTIWIVMLLIVKFGVELSRQHRGLEFYAEKCLACKFFSNIPESSDLVSPKLIRMHWDALLTSCKQPSSVSKQSKWERQITSENYSYPLFISEIDIRKYDDITWSCLLTTKDPDQVDYWLMKLANMSLF